MNNIITLFSSIIPGLFGRSLKGGVGDIVLSAGPMVQFVLLVLLFFSVVSWAIIFSKFRLIRKMEKNSKQFLEFFWKSKKLSSIFTQARKMRNSPHAEIFKAGYVELSKLNKMKAVSLEGKNPGDLTLISTELSGIDNLNRTLRQSVDTEVAKLEKALPFLATTGNTSPFIGLFGTVWGIMNAFKGIGIKGSASLAVVAPGISEALIATAAGLAAAIPAVVAYNYYLNRIKILASDMENFSSEFLNIIERHLL